MIIKKILDDSVVFICIDRQIDCVSKRIPVGTAFLVGLPDSSRTHLTWMYFITARHIIEESESDILFLRINKKDGGFVDFETKRDEWFKHCDTDIAARLFQQELNSDYANKLDLRNIPTQSFINEDYKYSGPASWDPKVTFEKFHKGGGIPVQLGNEIYFVGLFAQHAGEKRNLPIARRGMISRMPEEPITLPRDKGTASFETLAYLVESTSWSGHSGSPVFWVWPGIMTRKIKGKMMQMPSGTEQGLLGIVSAHYTTTEKARVTGDILGRIETDLNAGIVAVIPSFEIINLLQREDLSEDRKK